MQPPSAANQNQNQRRRSLSLRASLNLIVHSTANSKSSIYNRCNSQFIQQLFTQSYLSYIHYVLKAVLQLAINVYIVCYSSLSSCIFLKYIYSQLLLYLLSLSLSPAFICRVGVGEQMDDAGTQCQGCWAMRCFARRMMMLSIDIYDAAPGIFCCRPCTCMPQSGLHPLVPAHPATLFNYKQKYSQSRHRSCTVLERYCMCVPIHHACPVDSIQYTFGQTYTHRLD